MPERLKQIANDRPETLQTPGWHARAQVQPQLADTISMPTLSSTSAALPARTRQSRWRVDRAEIERAIEAHPAHPDAVGWDLRLAVEHYARSASVNDYLRGTYQPLSDDSRDSMLRQVQRLDALMHPLTHPLRLVRGVRLSRLLVAGDTLVDGAYLSASAERSMARQFTRRGRRADRPCGQLLELQIDAGVPYLPLTRLARLQRDEQELLLGRGLAIDVERVDSERAVPLVRARVRLASDAELRSLPAVAVRSQVADRELQRMRDAWLEQPAVVRLALRVAGRVPAAVTDPIHASFCQPAA